jgi:hypothetical protein
MKKFLAFLILIIAVLAKKSAKEWRKVDLDRADKGMYSGIKRSRRFLALCIFHRFINYRVLEIFSSHPRPRVFEIQT